MEGCCCMYSGIRISHTLSFSSSQSNAVINFFRHLLKTPIFQTSVSFPWRFKESEFLCSLVEMDNIFNMKRGRSAFKVLQKTGLKMLL